MLRLDRLRWAMDAKQLSQGELARRVGVTAPAIQQIVNGATKRTRVLPEIADVLEVSVAWLKGDSDEMVQLSPSERRDEAFSRELGVTAVREIDLTDPQAHLLVFSTLHLNNSTKDDRKFEVRVLKEATGKIDPLVLTGSMPDHSMSSTIFRGDQLLIFCEYHEVSVQNKIWFFSYAGLPMVRRLLLTSGNNLQVSADNPSEPSFEIPSDKVSLIGRIAWIGRSI
jgi:phage repressor protein C with HTH and peptisase S24 domain